jgi:hypothetical protein
MADARRRAVYHWRYKRIAMRKKPITRDEVRVDHFAVWTLPSGSFHRDTGQPVAQLWQPLLDQLRQQEREWWDSGPAAKPELWGAFESRVEVAYPSAQATCHQCGRRFYCPRNGSKWCSDLCVREARAPRLAAVVKAKSKARAEARAGGTCKTCGEPIKAQRATKQYCSVGCRVAALRARDRLKRNQTPA